MCSYFSRAALAVLILIAAGVVARAQSQAAQPYAGLETRAIKALSDQEIADLTAGRGMGTALPAELNGYPGPTHVLEYADELGLTGQQRADVRQLFDSMKSEAIPLGQRLISAERELDRDFADRTITPERLKAATAAIAEIRGELRNTHLKYHLSTAALLAPEQIHRYAELRGYGSGGCRAACAAATSGESIHQHMMKHD
jgi:LTXXQ motif family protein